MTALSNKYYNKNSKIKFVNHVDMEIFLDEALNSQYDSFLDLCEAIHGFEIKTTVFNKKSYYNKNINKIIGAVYTNIMKFSKNTFVTDSIFSNFVLENVGNIIFNREVIHHLHITDKVISYVHRFCNQKVREIKISKCHTT